MRWVHKTNKLYDCLVSFQEIILDDIETVVFVLYSNRLVTHYNDNVTSQITTLQLAPENTSLYFRDNFHFANRFSSEGWSILRLCLALLWMAGFQFKQM